MADHLLVRLDQVTAGVTDWGTVTDGTTGPLDALRAAILGLSTAATWGGDSAGSAFAGSYGTAGGPAVTLFGERGGQGLLAALAEYGPAVGEALRAAVATDERAAAAVAAAGRA